MSVVRSALGAMVDFDMLKITGSLQAPAPSRTTTSRYTPELGSIIESITARENPPAAPIQLAPYIPPVAPPVAQPEPVVPVEEPLNEDVVPLVVTEPKKDDNQSRRPK